MDQNTHLPLKTSFYLARNPEDKQKNVEDEVYDNYRLVQGIMTPHSITRNFNGEMSTSALSTSLSTICHSRHPFRSYRELRS